MNTSTDKKPMTTTKKRKLIKMVENLDAEQKIFVLGVAHGIKAASGMTAAKN